MESNKYLFGLGAYRLLLAWMVIACHTVGYYELFAFDSGTIAVSTFFFISGYLMPLTYEKNYAHFQWRIGMKKFFINRFIRIFPIYWVTILIPVVMSVFVSAIHGKWEGINPSPTLTGWIQNILLIGLNQSFFWGGYERINNPAWTLDVELQYYILVPFFLFAYQKFKKLTILGLFFLSIIGILLYFRPVNLVDIDRSFIAWSFFFITGFLFYKYDEKYITSSKLFIALAIIVFLLSFELHLEKLILVKNFLYSLIFISISIPLLIIQKGLRFHQSDKVLGDLSYPTYIIHFFVLSISIKLSGLLGLKYSDTFIFYITLAINIILTTFISIIVIRFIADPIEKYRSKVRGKNI